MCTEFIAPGIVAAIFVNKSDNNRLGCTDQLLNCMQIMTKSEHSRVNNIVFKFKNETEEIIKDGNVEYFWKMIVQHSENISLKEDILKLNNYKTKSKN